MMGLKLDEYRTGRNFVRLGDEVIARPEGMGPYRGRVIEIHADDEGNVEWVQVVIALKLNGAPHGHAGKWRIVTPDRIQRVAQTKVKAR